MTEFLAAFLIFLAAVVAMAVGVIVGRRRIKGSCGGLANLRDDQGRTMCEACTDPSPECRGDRDEAGGNAGDGDGRETQAAGTTPDELHSAAR